MSDSSKVQKPTVEQQEAINYDGKSLLITAGPGAGKTYVLVKRIKYLLEEKHVDPESILVITFTRKAADQLKEKLSKDKDIGASAVNKMFINTIHSFCIHFLSENGCSDINLLESTSGNECKLMFLRKHKKELGFNREAYMSGRNLHDVINKYFTISNMVVVGSQYWNNAFGRLPGEAIKDEEGMQTMRHLGKNMAFIVKCINDGKVKYKINFTEEHKSTNFIRM